MLVELTEKRALSFGLGFVCLGFFVPLEKFLIIWRRHHCRAANLAFVDSWYLRGPVTLAPIAEHLAVRTVTTCTCYYDLCLSRLDSNTQPSACEANALAHCATAAVLAVGAIIIFPVASESMVSLMCLWLWNVSKAIDGRRLDWCGLQE